MKTYADPGGCYPSRPRTLLDLLNSSYYTEPHPIICDYTFYLQMVTNRHLLRFSDTFIIHSF